LVQTFNMIVYVLTLLISSLLYLQVHGYETMTNTFPFTTVVWKTSTAAIVIQVSGVLLATLTLSSALQIAEHILIDNNERLSILATMVAVRWATSIMIAVARRPKYVQKRLRTRARAF
jgi:hypothetical protein